MRCLTMFVCLFAVAAGRRVNYCGARMCRNTNAHTFCQYPPGPSLDCMGYIEAHLTKEEKSRVLARLNRRRSDAASGRLRGLPGAGDMLKLRWIEELAKEAQLWANQCRPHSSPEEKDECRDLYSVSVGQCIASVVGEAPGLRVESMVDMWYMQSLVYKGNISSYVPPESDRQFYGDFGQMLWSRSYMVGCARSRFMVVSQGRLRSVERLVCNLAPAGPAPYRALWSRAAPAAACPPRSRPDHAMPALCNYQLEMNESDMVNNTMSIQEHVLLNSALEAEKNESLFGIGSLDELYLTNLAIVTMENEIGTSTSLYNSLKKRDIAEPIDVSNFNVNVKDKQKRIQSNFYKTPKISKKKISTIGRPKTYNMAELTEIGDDQKEDNHEIIEDVTKNLVDMYGDYNIVDTQEENETTITDGTELTTDLNKLEQPIDSKSIIHSANVMNKAPINESTEENIADLIQLPDASENITMSNVIESNETIMDYNDPETVRQLQETLDRMEKENESSKMKTKVRRELRESTPTDDSSDSTTSPDDERNMTAQDRGPMLNMMMKYMPIFKQYEDQLLGKTNSAGCLRPSVLVLSLLVCL